MASVRGVAIRQVWEERLGRYRSSGLTVVRFCANEGVSVNTFYYWARRVGPSSTATAQVGQNGTAGRGLEEASRGHIVAGTSDPALVRFHFNAAVEVSVPAHCLDVICCLVECLQQPRRAHSEAFREVVVGPR
jgi:hypothetical protein